MVEFKKHNIIRLIRRIEEKIRMEESYINELDSKIGDGDHGSNMANSFANMRELIVSEESNDLGVILTSMGESFLVSGGGMGPYLYGNSIKEASSVVSGQEIMSIENFIEILEKMTKVIKTMGDVEFGDKTLYDVIARVVEVLEKDKVKLRNNTVILEKIAHTSEDAMLSTKKIIAKKGRASLFGEKSIGHIDPGAYSMYLIFSEIFEFYKDERILEFLQKE